VSQRRRQPGQYNSAEFRRLLDANRISQSLSRPRQCWGNAVAEAWFSTLKLELIDRQSWASRAQVRRAVFEFVEVFYNRRRLHSSLGYLAGRLRGSDPPPHGGSGRIINLSAESGQPQWLVFHRGVDFAALPLLDRDDEPTLLPNTSETTSALP